MSVLVSTPIALDSKIELSLDRIGLCSFICQRFGINISIFGFVKLPVDGLSRKSSVLPFPSDVYGKVVVLPIYSFVFFLMECLEVGFC